MPYAHSDSAPAALTHAPAPPKEREKLEGGVRLQMNTEFKPAGDQPTAIKELSAGVLDGEQNLFLFFETGTC